MTTLAVDPRDLAPEEGYEPATDAPTIGVVVSLTFPQMGEEAHELMTRFTRTAFAELRAAGAHPILIDSAAAQKPDPVEAALAPDGLVFLGGGDVDGALYGQPSLATNTFGVDRRADDFCLAMLTAAIEADRTVFAICRGSQLLNVALGGTLVPDLQPSDLHRGGPGQPMFVNEEVVLHAGSHLSDIFTGSDLLTVRSGHHQAVDRVGDRLRVTATAHDGIVEATEVVDRSWIVGVQWHPEDDHGSAADRVALFGAFVEQCRMRRSVARERVGSAGAVGRPAELRG
ncbi:gamma-glutamyl-gamma-aminobutyrate hydrolase family protein [Glaciibacter psychrotolerans]|uniref:Putative glutamine amidotransferase n=1 Tax=Glaciibacter psychrotolerans TaxID=670054 RepID=A0A7Z0EG88_9MICO|nr:gamma-glutamyl-gamma-aminobutyrate hydrolase family protein [Leifsonia psychrotolerans]NYJ21108.1 putative glutamine amidotransferase [Leifsonia psychrotolerans]